MLKNFKQERDPFVFQQDNYAAKFAFLIHFEVQLIECLE